MDIKKLNYPIYIVSKGRWEKPYTAQCFLNNNIDFSIVVEPQEYEKYKTTIPERNIKILPFSNLGLGSYPARNWCWENSIENEHSKHWIFDDNIRGFSRLNNGSRKPTNPILAIESAESFVDRYKNIALSGFNYRYFVTKLTKYPFVSNVHVYSALLIDNYLPFRWRLKYNEDVDLCLQALTRGYCTVLLNAFLIDKISTSAKLKGGNQDELYKGNDPIKKALKAQTLAEMWPQYVKIVKRFNRPHHAINWKKHFKHKLIKKITEAV